MRNLSLLLAASLCACATAPQGPPAYRATGLSAVSPYSAGQCGIEIADFRPGKLQPAQGSHLPMWAEHEQTREHAVYSSFGDGTDYRQFLEHELYEAKQAFSEVLTPRLIEERKTHHAASTGMSMEGSMPEYKLTSELVALTPPGEDPKTPLKLTMRFTVADGKGAAESVEIDTESEGANFRGAGRILAEKYWSYVQARLGCWTNWQ